MFLEVVLYFFMDKFWPVLTDLSVFEISEIFLFRLYFLFRGIKLMERQIFIDWIYQYAFRRIDVIGLFAFEMFKISFQPYNSWLAYPQFLKMFFWVYTFLQNAKTYNVIFGCVCFVVFSSVLKNYYKEVRESI